MTKNIEGTVDDDIAAKLAIGEGRQVRIPKQFSLFCITSRSRVSFSKRGTK